MDEEGEMLEETIQKRDDDGYGTME